MNHADMPTYKSTYPKVSSAQNVQERKVGSHFWCHSHLLFLPLPRAWSRQFFGPSHTNLSQMEMQKWMVAAHHACSLGWGSAGRVHLASLQDLCVQQLHASWHLRASHLVSHCGHVRRG